MYLDANRIAIIITSGILGLFVWWINDSRNTTDIADHIMEMETGVSSNPEKIAAQYQNYNKAVVRAKELMKLGQLEDASRVLYHAHREFEPYLSFKRETEVAPDLTLGQWHDQIAIELTEHWQTAYESGKKRLIEGGYSRREFSDILNHVPFPYIGSVQKQWQTDRPAIEEARAANASNWIVVAVYASMAGGADYKEKVEKALREKWPSDSSLKLVFGGAMSREEKKAAVRVINISVEGDKVSYQFVGADNKNGSRPFHENLVTTFETQSKSDRIPSTSWDKLPKITAHHKAPENLTVAFDRLDNKQQADFSRVLEEQKAGLLAEFESQLEAIPAFARM